MLEAVMVGVVGGMLTVVFGGILYGYGLEVKRLWG
jgi:hypothetical protein